MPWTFTPGTEVGDKAAPSFFSAPLSAFQITVPEAIDEDLKSITLQLETCGDAGDKKPDVSPCGIHRSLMRARNLAKEKGTDSGAELYGLRVGYLPYFSAADGSFVGKCAIAELHQLDQSSVRDPCQIWVPENAEKVGIRVTLPAAALPHAVRLVEESKFLFRPEMASCAIVYRGAL